MSLVEVLPWDSSFFGVGIGQVDLDEVPPERLGDVDAEARELGLDCVYGKLDPSRPTDIVAVQKAGFDLVEVGIRFRRPAVPFTPRPTRSVVRRGTVEDLERMDQVIEPLVPWSRYAVDPRFGPDAARRLFHAWVERAATCTDDTHMLAVTEDEDGITGISTNTRVGPPRVDLMSVIEKGSGAAWSLMAEAIEWAGGDGAYDAGPCAARNLAPLRFLEHCGFFIHESRYTFHRWLDRPARGAS